MADAGGRIDGIGKILALEPQSDIDQADQDRHLHQGTDHGGKGLARINAEDRHRHGDGQFEIIGGGRKTQSGGLLVGGAGLHGQ